jgi:hypothetical protein
MGHFSRLLEALGAGHLNHFILLSPAKAGVDLMAGGCSVRVDLIIWENPKGSSTRSG